MNLEQAFRQTMAELELTSCGTTSSWNSSGNGKKGSREPVTGDGEPPHLRYRRLWVERPFRRSELLEEAQAELKAIRKAKPAPKTRERSKGDRDREICGLPSGFSPGEVSLKFKCSETEVRKARLAGGLHPDTGEIAVTRTEMARRLREDGLSAREIARRLGVSHTTINEDLAA